MGADANGIDTTGLYRFASVSLLTALFKLMGRTIGHSGVYAYLLECILALTSLI